MKPSYREKWGIPDWRNGAEYPKTLPMTLWRWEFLRRLEEYRRDWLKYAPKTMAYYRQRSPIDLFRGDWRDRRAFPVNWVCNDINDARFRAFMPGSTEKYGLDGLISPAISDSNFLQLGSAKSGLFRGPANLEIPAKHGAFLVDLTRPLDEQLHHIRIILKALQPYLSIPPRKRLTRRLWPIYLRALDAEADKASYKDFYTTVYPHHQTSNPRARGLEIFEAAHQLQASLTRPI